MRKEKNIVAKTKQSRYYYLEETKNKRESLSNYSVLNFIGMSNEPTVENSTLYKSKYGKYKCNQDYFEKIDNEYKAYWLGFLYADGCVSENKLGKGERLQLCLATVDRGHIEKFKNSLQADYPIKDFESKKGFFNSRIRLDNMKLCEDLKKLNCTSRKSLTLKFPTNEIVPDYLIRHFIRGYFDGDGYVSLNFEKRYIRTGFCGNEEFLTCIREKIIEQTNIQEVKVLKDLRSKNYSLSWSTVDSCFEIFKYLYEDCNIFLDRKLYKFDTLYWLD